MSEPDAKRKLIQAAMRRLADQGRAIEAGWMTYRGMMSPTAPPMQLRECRLAFYHGCSFLLQTMLHTVSDGDDITASDERRMKQIHDEIDRFERWIRKAPSAREYICPRCGRTSHNPTDISETYCGACHDWTG